MYNVKTSLLFVTHLPAFYKVNLYNEIAKFSHIFVIFIANGSQIRTLDFTKADCQFEYAILNTGGFESRNRIQSLYRLNKLISTIHYQKIIVGGWDLIEYWFLIFRGSKNSNALALESSRWESKTHGISKWLKKLFLQRVTLVFPSGEPHLALLNQLDYQGQIKKTLGVGLFNYHPSTPLRLASPSTFSGKFLYVGRISEEKNLRLLINTFNALPDYTLTIIGAGPLIETLKMIASDNIKIKDHVPNEALAQWYLAHDVFILPSLREPWGLVVEEALYYGLPVIVSERVGCAKDLVKELETGLLFDPYHPQELTKALCQMEREYSHFAKNVKKVDFKKRDQHQVRQYLEATK